MIRINNLYASAMERVEKEISFDVFPVDKIEKTESPDCYNVVVVDTAIVQILGDVIKIKYRRWESYLSLDDFTSMEVI